MKTKHTYTSLLTIATLLAASCTHNEIERPNLPPQDPQVTFSLQMPRATTKAITGAAPGTGLTDEEERAINNLTLLIFTETSTGDMLCEDVLKNLQPAPIPGTDNARYTVTATLPKGRYHLMFLANIAAKITANPPTGKLLSVIQTPSYTKCRPNGISMPTPASP